MNDSIQRFLFDHQDARGAITQLRDTCVNIQETHHYPPALATVINQFALSAVLLRDSLKVAASVTIQCRSEGSISLIMADCDVGNNVRAIAEYDVTELGSLTNIDLSALGNKTVLVITITPEDGDRYQGVVPIEHEKLADCLQDYFARSEQLPTLFSLMADEKSATGIAIHALPEQQGDAAQRRDYFDHLSTLLGTLTESEALTLSAEKILTRLFHQESCRLFETSPVCFGCPCSRERSLEALIGLGQSEVNALIQERRADGYNDITVDCHFCFQRYEYDFATLEQHLRQH